MSDVVNIKMTRTERGSKNGIRVDTFVEGECYTIPVSLANVFVNLLHCAKVVDEDVQEVELAKKARQPENKKAESEHDKEVDADNEKETPKKGNFKRGQK